MAEVSREQVKDYIKNMTLLDAASLVKELEEELGVPVFSLLEGGYSSDLPELILAYLQGLEGQNQPGSATPAPGTA